MQSAIGEEAKCMEQCADREEQVEEEEEKKVVASDDLRCDAGELQPTNPDARESRHR